MAKQIHIRIEDEVYESLTRYSADREISMQDCISSAIKQMLVKVNEACVPVKEQYTFIDLFAGIGGMHIAYASAGADVYIPMSGTSTANRPIMPTSVFSLMMILPKFWPRIFLTTISSWLDSPVNPSRLRVFPRNKVWGVLPDLKTRHREHFFLMFAEF